MSREYSTVGKKRLVEFFSANADRQYSAEEIYDMLSSGGPVGKSSLYRRLSKLCEDGVIRKFRNEGSDSFVYQYMDKEHDCENHFHLKCLSCGKILHLECKITDEMTKHILDEHSFCIDSGRSILYGKCKECSVRECKATAKG